MSILVNIIGAGNLGKTIGHLFVKNKLIKIGSICNTSEKSSSKAINFIGEGRYCSKISELPSADITFITTPDDLITKISEELSINKFIKVGSIVSHCSGSLTTDALISVKKIGCYVASIHPMRSFAQPELSITQYKGTYCAIEGDIEATHTLHDLFNSIGSLTYNINKNKKILYHAAGVFASNYLVTLSQQALLCLKEAGVENKIAMKVITSLMQSTVSNLNETLSPERSLTGPIKRGDISTIKNHIQSLLDINQKKIYSLLGNATLSLTDFDETKKEKIASKLLIED